MAIAALKKDKLNSVTIVKKMRDYGKETIFKKKAENAIAFIKKSGMPKSFQKKSK